MSFKRKKLKSFGKLYKQVSGKRYTQKIRIKLGRYLFSMAKYVSIMILVAIAAKLDFELFKADVKPHSYMLSSFRLYTWNTYRVSDKVTLDKVHIYGLNNHLAKGTIIFTQQTYKLVMRSINLTIVYMFGKVGVTQPSYHHK